MLFDLSDADLFCSLRLSERIDSVVLQKRSAGSLAVLSAWGEHCIECGVPSCYKTCRKFKKTFLGWCRRFDSGIRRVRFAGGGRGYAVKFRPWAKLELKFTGKMVPWWIANAVGWSNDFFVPLLVRMASWTSGKFGVMTPLSPYFRIRNYFRKHPIGKCIRTAVWTIGCFAEQEEELTCAVFDSEVGDVFIRRVHLMKGSNDFRFEIQDVREGMLFRISSQDGTHGDIIFYALEICSGAAKQSSETMEKMSHPVAKSPAPNVSTNPAKFVKCVAWDLDNTLWDGILVEDGPDGVSLKNSVVQVIKRLDERGILNTVCSKNDYVLAWKQLTKYGIADYFVFPMINWDAKSENIRRLAKEINIGLDAFAFIDDSPHERGDVAGHLPMVRVFEETAVGDLLQMECFNPPVSSESGTRRQSYLAEMKRRKFAAGFNGSNNDFIRDCQVKLRCEPIIAADVRKRCWELVNRTNQLTLAAHRYTEEEFGRLTSDSSVKAYAVRCQDKYGDYGIVGFVAIKLLANAAKVEEFVMSCRVAKKFCEQSVLAAIIEKLGTAKVKSFSAEVTRTGRNSALIEAFDVLPFRAWDTMNGNKHYELDETEIAHGWAGMFRNETVIEGDWE